NADLHAKAYVFEVGERTHLFVGSPNATDPGIGRQSNDEFLCELVFARRRFSVEILMHEGAPFRRVLAPFEPAPAAPLPGDQLKRAKEKFDAVGEVITVAVRNRQLHLVCEPAAGEVPVRQLLVPAATVSLPKLDSITVRGACQAPSAQVDARGLSSATSIEL